MTLRRVILAAWTVLALLMVALLTCVVYFWREGFYASLG